MFALTLIGGRVSGRKGLSRVPRPVKKEIAVPDLSFVDLSVYRQNFLMPIVHFSLAARMRGCDIEGQSSSCMLRLVCRAKGIKGRTSTSGNCLV